MNESRENHLVHGRRQRPTGVSPVDVITVQSQLVYGYAGNSAAVPPLHMLGMRVAAVPTTLLSNTPFYETLRGVMLPTDLFSDLLRGASERGLPQQAKALVSGYFGSLSNGQAFANWAEQVLPQSPGLRYFLDPVIGDTHTGPYVEDGLEKVIGERLLPLAWVVTPNAFELEQLTGMPALQEHDAIAAARLLLTRGPEWVIAHSIAGEPGELVTLAVSKDSVYRWASPYLPVDVAGTGDVLVALLLTFAVRGEPLPKAVGRAIAGVHTALEMTLQKNVEELDVQSAAPAALEQADRFPYTVLP